MLLSTLCVLASLTVPAQDAPAVEHLMTVRMGGLESSLSNSKDIGLRRALQISHARLRELPDMSSTEVEGEKTTLTQPKSKG
mgnify:FL=1